MGSELCDIMGTEVFQGLFERIKEGQAYDLVIIEDVQTWLDKSEDGCIYVSFGSMVRIETLPKYVLDALYASFKNISPVRVLMKIAKPEELPPNLPKNVMTQSWFSQVQVLKHKNIRAFVTHGGLASIQESVYAGVPMVGIPLFGDQNFNVISQVRRNVAVSLQLDGITEKTLTTAFKEILNNPSYKQNADEASKNFLDRPMAPIDTAVFWIEYVARHGKKCLRSPIVDMPWWQANLMDVYTVILIVPLIALYLLKLMFLSIFFAFFPRWKPENAKKTQ
ncbi:hypothetical protein QAD02_016518 [Eretmocerus hayati]|uniref:Uncharacterized protein n=1 Tax=Eretmocerus hayati TaxID=131215 RepID=A0ACC2PCK6_9HYME|nr:hypothetical protein QAD02_016518 [Eretmocerus hayati]